MKKMMITGLLMIALAGNSKAQDSTKGALLFSGYIETYYTYDFNKPVNNTLPGFFYNHNRANELNLSLGLLKLAYNNSNTRANLARAEYYSDKNGVIIAAGTPNGFQVWGYSLNFDYALRNNAVPVSGNTFLSTALAISF